MVPNGSDEGRAPQAAKFQDVGELAASVERQVLAECTQSAAAAGEIALEQREPDFARPRHSSRIARPKRKKACISASL